MDKLGHDGIYGDIVYWVLYKVHNETRVWVHAEDDNELLLEEDGEVGKGGGCPFSVVAVKGRTATKAPTTPPSLFVPK